MHTEKFSRSSTAKEQPPVCVADIPSFQFSVSMKEKTDFVTQALRKNINLPGVILYDTKGFAGMIPRQIIFERLGRRYGIELFLNKEISFLYKELKASEPLILDENIRVDEAVQQALSRKGNEIYNPVVIHNDGRYSMLDMQSLIIKQAEMLSNLNNIAKNLNNCENFIYESKKENGIEKIIDALREAVPFHDAGIFTFSKATPIKIKGEKFIHLLPENTEKTTAHKLPLSFHQVICMDDAEGVPLWENLIDVFKKHPKAWMGIPLMDNNHYLGILSLCRYTHTPYSVNEKELAKSFTWYLSQVLSKLISGYSTEQNQKNRFLNSLQEQEKYPCF